MYHPNQQASAAVQFSQNQPITENYDGVTPGVTPACNKNWSSGLFDCTSDDSNSWVTCFCPCITFGRIAEIVDKGNTCCGCRKVLYGFLALICCGCICSWKYRTKLRSQYGLRESPCNDCLVHCFCERCALCQEYRELKNRGFDLSLGWQGNQERRNLEVQKPPMAPGGMDR